ncbi:hypothetical protein G7K_0004-t1 [Saitoella complicata NRRL Y-17804]|uniref:Uncharacterized protein n=1 Tax=Saitoella complicata (strain BCRC 22490 / CBS 7301 / JCM 7358 / NBRC 10748 / NRRL Y-17804) TaxID=698492 RepID=A0A0E9N732_SAICN|nr:hypothetical protein G7K_0004-t1 [Saitoella complicata NRRL Y-17804]
MSGPVHVWAAGGMCGAEEQRLDKPWMVIWQPDLGQGISGIMITKSSLLASLILGRIVVLVTSFGLYPVVPALSAQGLGLGLEWAIPIHRGKR